MSCRCCAQRLDCTVLPGCSRSVGRSLCWLWSPISACSRMPLMHCFAVVFITMYFMIILMKSWAEMSNLTDDCAVRSSALLVDFWGKNSYMAEPEARQCYCFFPWIMHFMYTRFRAGICQLQMTLDPHVHACKLVFIDCTLEAGWDALQASQAAR